MTSAACVDVARVAREDARGAFLSSIARARDALSDDDADRLERAHDDDDDDDSRDADVDARALAAPPVAATRNARRRGARA